MDVLKVVEFGWLTHNVSRWYLTADVYKLWPIVRDVQSTVYFVTWRRVHVVLFVFCFDFSCHLYINCFVAQIYISIDGKHGE